MMVGQFEPIMMVMTKMPVIPGVWWVEIPEADLRILCGTPMDSIKHLIRRGLVRKIEKNGAVYETGPNAILLSDRTIQRGLFWNMAEFPVLHMLFRQGMSIPGHPGNTGRKPLLIGGAKRAEAVLSYIYRGTYGLASRKEMKSAGLAGRDLDEQWRVKKKFSSGEIKSPHELIDVINVGADAAELPGGVLVRRKRTNLFEFQFAGNTVEVDLDLPEGEDWTASYVLERKEIKDGFFSVAHIGEGNGWDPDRPCMGSLVTYNGRRYLIDGGPGIDYSLESLGIDASEIWGLIITHAHDDHFAGLTRMLRGDRKIKVYATRPVMATVRLKCAALLEREPAFLDRLVDVRYLEVDEWNDIGGLEVRPVYSPHPVETTILYFRALWEGGYRSYGHLADIAARSILEGFVGDDGVSVEFVERVFGDYLRKCDVKKIDAGRGMIHGVAEDFRDDPSDVLILSHKDGKLSPEEKEIGAEVSFGQTDVLIPDRSDRMREWSAELLGRTVPGIRKEDEDLLLNGKIQCILPGTPLLKKGKSPESLLLVVSGTVETCDKGKGANMRFTAGSLVGEYELLSGEKAPCTYRTRGHVKTLRIPSDLYVHALKKTDLLEGRSRILSNRGLLVGSGFPAAVVGCPRLDYLASSLVFLENPVGADLSAGSDALYVLMKGTVEAVAGSARRKAAVGEWTNLREVLPFVDVPEDAVWEPAGDAVVAALPGSLIREIPVLVWTLAEVEPPA